MDAVDSPPCEALAGTWIKEDVRQLQDVGIPDDILRAFDESYDICSMLLPANLPTYDHSIEARYEYQANQYLSTICNYGHMYRGKRCRQLTIKLCHAGFRYHHRPTLQDWTDYGHDGSTLWVTLAPVVLEKMPHLKRLKERLKADLTFLYSIKKRRIDLLFVPKGAPMEEPSFLLIMFGPGSPHILLNRAELRI